MGLPERSWDGRGSSSTRSQRRPGLIAPDRLRQCLGAAGRGEPEQHLADARLPLGEQPVAAVLGDPLAVLEHAQLAGQVDQVVRVGADPQPPAVVAVGGERKEPVCEVRLGQRAEARDRAASSEAAALALRSCGWRGSRTSARRDRRVRPATRSGARRVRR